MKTLLVALTAVFVMGLITPFAPAAEAAPPSSVATPSGQQTQPCDCAG